MEDTDIIYLYAKYDLKPEMEFVLLDESMRFADSDASYLNFLKDFIKTIQAIDGKNITLDNLKDAFIRKQESKNDDRFERIKNYVFSSMIKATIDHNDVIAINKRLEKHYADKKINADILKEMRKIEIEIYEKVET